MEFVTSPSRIILSRKGFDATHGGRPSPILPDGRLCPLPIPERIGRGGIPYGRLRCADRSLAEMAGELGIPEISAGRIAHLDPDLHRPIRDRRPGWRPLFGQANAAERHLQRQGVDRGDLFLFFGWFRETERRNGRLAYARGAPDRHVIFGWLQVERRVQLPDVGGLLPAWAADHPHAGPVPYGPADSIYLSTRLLGLPGLAPSLPGGGLFPVYDDALCLTAPGHSRGVWSLPGWFFRDEEEQRLTYHHKSWRWQPAGNRVLLRSVGRGQEFVLRAGAYPEMESWLPKLFRHDLS